MKKSGGRLFILYGSLVSEEHTAQIAGDYKHHADVFYIWADEV